MSDPLLVIRADADLSNAVALGELPGTSIAPGSGTAVDESGQEYPAQVTALANGNSLVGVQVRELASGSELRLRFQGGGAPAPGRGVDLDDQPENGRIVVTYSGFLQTIYHYGAMNYKPRFYPITAPCAKLGGFDDPATVYPKGITDDAPPDHIWHRSLWYAAGEVFVGPDSAEAAAAHSRGTVTLASGAGSMPETAPGAHPFTDFYLENGGEGRMVHRSFSDVFSGPVFGGFRESLVWRTPDGRDIISDERSLTMYRLKGTSRIFDIAAAFTALDQQVTFGATNENALPLIRVADCIDEWDGGRLTLADGTIGGKDAFARRAAWGDCTGPLIHKPGLEPQYWGVAMLDHPSNVGHPNAWFARSYGPLGTNTPYFDGPLTLAPGETWTLRHRIVVHEGYPEEAGIQGRWDEYARPPSITIASSRKPLRLVRHEEAS